MLDEREHWGSYAGFIFASIGSAVGIGNIWRFPYIVGTNGGGAFLIPYAIIMIVFGLSFMILEFAVGRYYQTSIIECLGKIKHQFKWVGLFTVIISSVVLSYYLVILGWILGYLLVLNFDHEYLDFDRFNESVYPIISFIAIVIINFLVLRKGIKNGIEKLAKWGMIVFLALLIPLTINGILLPNAEEGIEFYLTPNVDKLLDSTIWANAFGQAFFSLSIGFGTLLVYGSYLKGKHSLFKSSSIIIIFDTAIAIIAGLMIFSFVFAYNMEPDVGVSLIFKVMVSVFLEMEFGILLGTMFFSLLLVAGLTSSISLFQVPISALEDSLKYSRNKSVFIVFIIIPLVGVPSLLSYSIYDLSLFEIPILDLMDEIFGTYGLSISAILFSIIVLWFMDKKKLLTSVNMNSSLKISHSYLKVMKFSLPSVIAITIIYRLFFS